MVLIAARSFQSNLVGQPAEVRERIRPGKPGKVFLNGELWQATANESLAPGRRVEVAQVEGLVLQVAPLKEGAGPDSLEPGAAS